MGIKFPFTGRQVFDLVAAFLPAAISTGVRTVEAAITGSSSKKEKAVNIALGGLAILNGLPGFVTDNPEFRAKVEQINDLVVEAANIAATLAEATPAPTPEGGAAPGPDGTP